MIWQLSMGDLQTYQESKEYAIIVIVYKLNQSTISCWYVLNTLIYAQNI